MARKFTDKLLEMIEEGLLDKDTVIMACVKYMSEDDVKNMMEANEFLEEEDETPKWVIKDWAGNTCFKGEEFDSFDDAEDFLTDKLGDAYDTDRQEYEIEEIEA